jgi:hypothetical protein
MEILSQTALYNITSSKLDFSLLCGRIRLGQGNLESPVMHLSTPSGVETSTLPKGPGINACPGQILGWPEKHWLAVGNFSASVKMKLGGASAEGWMRSAIAEGDLSMQESLNWMLKSLRNTPDLIKIATA